MSTMTFGQGHAAQRSKGRFMANAVETASPSALLVMLLDRLVLDVARGEEAQRAGRPGEAGPHLTHAQDILGELISSLDVDAWEGGPRLLSVYTFLMAELVRANVSGDASRTRACLPVVESLRDTWREAAVVAAATSGTGRVG